jgi:uncharacterized protein (DUF433 family)
MSTQRKTRVVASLEEASENIRSYQESVSEYPLLAARIRQHPAWYAVKDGAGRWIFGPSKFIGYHAANAQAYLSGYNRKDGKETEPVLSEWFEQVDLSTKLGSDLREAFIRFAATFGKSPNLRWRIAVPREHAAVERLGPGIVDFDFSDRIVFDPEICGGRARIAGTRVRVSDIVSMLAGGASQVEILSDFPYLKAEDVSAALGYAARAVDHRVLKAA